MGTYLTLVDKVNDAFSNFLNRYFVHISVAASHDDRQFGFEGFYSFCQSYSFDIVRIRFI